MKTRKKQSENSVFHIQQEKEKIRVKLISDFEKNLEKNILKQLQLKFKKKKYHLKRIFVFKRYWRINLEDENSSTAIEYTYIGKRNKTSFIDAITAFTKIDNQTRDWLASSTRNHIMTEGHEYRVGKIHESQTTSYLSRNMRDGKVMMDVIEVIQEGMLKPLKKNVGIIDKISTQYIGLDYDYPSEEAIRKVRSELRKLKYKYKTEKTKRGIHFKIVPKKRTLEEHFGLRKHLQEDATRIAMDELRQKKSLIFNILFDKKEIKKSNTQP